MLAKSFLMTVVLASLDIESLRLDQNGPASQHETENLSYLRPEPNKLKYEGASQGSESSESRKLIDNQPSSTSGNSNTRNSVQSSSNCFRSISARSSYSVTKELKTWNSYLEDIEPGAVVTPSTEQEVSEIIKCASRSNSTVSVQSGGHSYEGYWRGNPGGVVIDLKNMNKLKMTNRGTIKVGAGSLLGPVIAKLAEESKNTQYTYALPHGLQPVLGMGGHTLGGGFGLLSRKYGLLVDKVVNIKMINAKGKIITVNKSENPDLFTALRGAGAGSFGVVTEFEYEYVKLPKKLTVARLTWNTTKQNFTSVWNNIMDYYNTQKDVGVTQYVNYMPGGKVEMGATFSHDNVEEQEQSYNKVISKLNPDIKVKENRGFVEAYSYYAGLAGKDGDLTIQKLKNIERESGSRYFKGRSGYFVKPLKNKAVTDKLGALLHDNSKAGFFLLMDLWRGNILKEDCDAPTSFIHRDVLASAQIGAVVDNPESKKLAKEIYDLLKPYFPQAYQNYIDKEVPHYMTTYYGHMAQFLVDVKNEWDPTDMFNFERSIPLKLSYEDQTILKTLKPTSLQGCCGTRSSTISEESPKIDSYYTKNSVYRRQELDSVYQRPASNNPSLQSTKGVSLGQYPICQKISQSFTSVNSQPDQNQGSINYQNEVDEASNDQEDSVRSSVTALADHIKEFDSQNRSDDGISNEYTGPEDVSGEPSFVSEPVGESYIVNEAPTA